MNRALTCVALVSAFVLATGVTSLPAQSLEGRVVHGVDSSGVAGVMVELHRVTATAGSVVDTSVSSPDGSFSFGIDQAGSSDALWMAAARRGGILYFGPARHAGQSAGEAYEILVYDSMSVTAPPADLRVGIRHLVVTAGPTGGFEVAEVFDVLGSAHRTLVPVPDTLAIWSSSLPASAISPRAIEGGVPPDAVSFESGEIVLRSTISPLGARVTFVYATRSPELEIRIDHPTDRLEVVIAGLDVEVTGASPGPSTLSGGQTALRYTSENLLPGATVRVSVPNPPGAGPQALIWALIGMALILAAGIVWATEDHKSNRLRSRPTLR